MTEPLDRLAAAYSNERSLALDPLSVVLDFEDPWDREVAAWVAAHLAYGRVAPMMAAIRRVLAPLGTRPAHRLREQSEAEIERELEVALGSWVWRFHTASDLVAWILAWRFLDRESGGLGLQPHILPQPGESPDAALSRLVHRLRRELPRTRGLRFSLPDPLEGSACKRWRMFLRWMVRPGWPDLGQWSDYPTSGLVIPLDTHVARVSRLIGLSRRRTPDGRMAAEITASLREADPEDPLRYDFALSHLGILGDCPGGFREPDCAPCPLAELCGSTVTKRKTP